MKKKIKGEILIMKEKDMNDVPEDLKKLEKKAFRATLDDGFLDILFGMVILGFGLNAVIPFKGASIIGGSLIFPLFWNAISVIIFFVGKKFISIPRIGIVKFSPKRRVKKIRFKIFMVLMLIINTILLVIILNNLFIIEDVNRYIFPLVFGLLIITLPLSVVAYFLDFSRLFIIGLFGGLGFFLTELLYPLVGEPLDFILVFVSIGSAIIMGGMIILIKFLKTHSLPADMP